MTRTANVREILELSSELIRFGAVSVGAHVADEGIRASYHRIRSFLEQAGLNVIAFDEGGRFPSLYCDAGQPGSSPCADTLLAGHFDVVPPDSPEQLEPVVDGDWLRGRGAADMLTVVATGMTFMRDLVASLRGDHAAPRFGLLLVSNEECGETEPWGTPHILMYLAERFGYRPSFLIAGERTGDGAVPFGLVEVRNRGVLRVHAEAGGEATHSALVRGETAIGKILALERAIREALGTPQDKFWRTSFQTSYVHGGELDNFNTTAKHAVAGFELRPALDDDLDRVTAAIERAREELGIRASILNCDRPIASDPDDPRIRPLVEAVAAVAELDPKAVVGPGKLPGTQARFAKGGCVGVVWGQAGVGPHTSFEAHYIPSIAPFYEVLQRLYGAPR